MKKYEIESKIRSLRTYLQSIVENAGSERTWEEKKILSCIDDLKEKLYDAEHDMKYYSKEPKVGKLHLQSDGRYALEDTTFTSGHGMEMFLYDPYEKEEVWFTGRVECKHTENGPVYYFLNSDGPNKDLEIGDMVRVRL